MTTQATIIKGKMKEAKEIKNFAQMESRLFAIYGKGYPGQYYSLDEGNRIYIANVGRKEIEVAFFEYETGKFFTL